MTTKQFEFAQGTVNPVGGRRIGVVNAGVDGGESWAKLMIIGGPAQVDATVGQGEPLVVEGFGTVTLRGIAVPADAARNRGPVISVEIELADTP
ncbi:MAG: hypothetical protein ACTH31_06195 [Pseudoclavibacter sp.]